MSRTHCAKSTFLVAALAGAMMLAGTPALAATVIGTESATTGFVGPLLAGFPSFVTVASDGESSFDPFGFGADTSDGIKFSGFTNGPWIQAADSQWTQLSNAETWVLPAANPAGPGCPGENAVDSAPGCYELIGHFIQPAFGGVLPQWQSQLLGEYVILDADGSIGDKITLFNSANGAELIFQSDPIPEPASMALVGLGLLGLAGFRRRRA